MKNLLITGATGFVGGHLLEAAVEKGYTVFAGVRKSSSLENLSGLPVQTFPIDLFKPENLLHDLFQFAEKHGGFQYIIHGAAITKPKKLEQFMIGNADFTEIFIKEIQKTQPNFKRFLLLSSMAAVGPGDPVSMKPIEESDIPNPNVPYGKSKRAQEIHLENAQDFPHNIIRPIAVYGEGDEKFLERVIGLIKKGLSVSLGSSKARSAFVHVDDVVQAIFLALESEVSNEAFNISDGNYYDQALVGELIQKEFGQKALNLRIPRWAMLIISYVSMAINSMLGKPTHLSPFKVKELTALNWNIDISKAKNLLGYLPQSDLPTGLKKSLHPFLDE